MVKCGVKRLPVVDKDRVVGIVSRTDVLRSMHRTDEELQAEIAAVLSDPVRLPETTMVDVSVADGIVTVRGSVRYPSDLPVLPAIVWRFPGVASTYASRRRHESPNHRRGRSTTAITNTFSTCAESHR